MKSKAVFRLIVSLIISGIGIIIFSYPFASREGWWMVGAGVVILVIGNAIASKKLQRFKKQISTKTKPVKHYRIKHTAVNEWIIQQKYWLVWYNCLKYVDGGKFTFSSLKSAEEKLTELIKEACFKPEIEKK